MTTPVDLVWLRGSLTRTPWTREERNALNQEIQDALPLLFDELEALRAEVDSYRTLYRTQAHTAVSVALRIARVDAEIYEMVLTSLYLAFDALGDHHESAQPPPATRPRYCYRCNDSGVINWPGNTITPCDHCQRGKP